MSDRRDRTRTWCGAFAFRVTVAACLASLPACDSISEEERAASPTGGVELSLQVLRTGVQQYELFRVTHRGEIEYGGGMRAFNGTTGWTGHLTAEQIGEFLTLLDSTGWCEHEPPDDREDLTRVRIEVRCHQGRHTWNVRGESEGVKRMVAFLDPIARRRLEPELDRLPSPNEPPPAPEGDASKRGGESAPP